MKRLTSNNIFLTESQPLNRQESELVPFGDDPEPSSAQLRREIAALQRQNALLQEENKAVKRRFRPRQTNIASC